MEVQAQNLPVNGPLLKGKALVIASSIGFETFKASNRWLKSFNCHHNLSSKTLSSKSNAMDVDVVNNWKAQLTFLLRDYDLSDIWNMDETGLFWHGLPTKSLTAKTEQAKGGKLVKE